VRVTITGGAGFLGHRLALALADRGDEVTVIDHALPPVRDPRLTYRLGELHDPATRHALTGSPPDAVCHLAAVVSSDAEANFDHGMHVNLDATRTLLDDCRTLPHPPRFVFTSSMAAFGGALPDVLDDTTAPKPQSSYGTQKVIGEHLVSDYSRRGFVDGRSVRLPTVVVRPGRANLAASSFASGIVREPVNGEPAVCPVERTTGIWITSPRQVVRNLVHALDLPAAAWGTDRVLNLPGISVTVDELLAALAEVSGPSAAGLVTFVPDEKIRAIVDTWPVRCHTDRARDLGFGVDTDVVSIVRAHVAEHQAS
jgi:D-erythronate 2-dehydrogenase